MYVNVFSGLNSLQVVIPVTKILFECSSSIFYDLETGHISTQVRLHILQMIHEVTSKKGT